MKNSQKGFTIVPIIIIILLIGAGVYFLSRNQSPVSKESEQNSPTKEINTGDDTELVYNKFFDGKIKILLPKYFKLMDGETAKLKYPSEQRPQIIYTNEGSSVNIAFSVLDQKISEKDLLDISKLYGNILKNNTSMKQNEIKTINEKKVLLISFTSKALDTDVYNLIRIGVFEGKLFMLTFNSTIGELGKWKSVGDKIINSVKFN